MSYGLNLNDHQIPASAPKSEAELIDEIHALNAQMAGKRVELCMLQGNRAGAEAWAAEMASIVLARKAARGVSA
jgi:hypothetical protein